MSKTQDKAAEAEFFLQLLRERLEQYRSTNDLTARQQFRFILSAFVSAARSITWVLQSEYRGKTTADFEAWWDVRRKELQKHPVARLCTELRNVSQKQGNRLPMLQFHGENPEGSQIQITYDPSASGGDGVVSLRFTPARMPLHPVRPDLRDEEWRKHVAETAAEDLAGALSEEALSLFVPTVELLVINDAGKVVPYEEFIQLAADYLSELRQIANEAVTQLPRVSSEG